MRVVSRSRGPPSPSVTRSSQARERIIAVTRAPSSASSPTISCTTGEIRSSCSRLSTCCPPLASTG
eukprot:16304647-Heterocapsa_arctica.AAC.1